MTHALGLLATVGWLAACSGEPEPEQPEPAIVVPEIESVPEHTVQAINGSADAANVELRFYGMSDLHRGFFADPRFVETLGTELGACISGTAQVLVSYDSEKWIGRIVLKVPPDQLDAACLPAVSGSTADLTPLQPIGIALANYRDAVANNFDFRVASFRVGTSFTRGVNQCNLQIAGQHPPDGRRWSPCVSFAGREICGAGDRILGVTAVQFDEPAQARSLSTCFAR